MRARPRNTVAVLLAAALLVVAAASLVACGDHPPDAGPVKDEGGTPKPGGTLTFPLPGEPVSIEPLNAQDAAGLQVAHQVFQGLTKWVRNDDGVLVTEPDIAANWESTDAQTWVFHLKPGVTFQAPVSRPVTAQDFVDSWTRVTDPDNQSYVAYILAPIEGCDDRGYQTDPIAGAHGSQRHRRPDAAGHAPLSLRRLPGHARPSGRRGDARGLHRPGRRQGLRKEAGGHRSLRGGVVAARQGDPPRPRTPHTGTRSSPAGWTRWTSPSTTTSSPCGRISRRASSTARRSPPSRSPRSRRAPRSPTVRGRPAPGRPQPSTSSAST